METTASPPIVPVGAVEQTPGLSQRQRDAFLFIRSHLAAKGIAPTQQEIGDALGVSRVTAFELVGHLESRGYIRRLGVKGSRSIVIVKQEAAWCPHCGGKL